MDKDINILINKACTKYCEQVDSVYNEKDVFSAGAQFGYNLCFEKWQEAERWRKFTTDDLPNLGMRILLKNGNRRDTTVVHSHQHIHELAECFTEWKPIS